MPVRKKVNYDSEYLAKLEEMYYQAAQSPIIEWAEEEFNWAPFKRKDDNGQEWQAWYQYIMLGCFDNLYMYPKDYEADPKMAGKPIKKFVWRVGRQCLAKDTVIHTRDGLLTRIDQHPDAWKTSNDREIFELKIDGGYALRATDNHPVMTSNGWKQLKDININDYVQVLDYWHQYGNGEFDFLDKHINLNEDICELIGWLTSSQAIKSDKKIKFFHADNAYLKRVQFLIKEYFPNVKTVFYKKLNSFYLTLDNDESFTDFLKFMDFDESGFPKNICYANKGQLIAFIKAAFTIGGHFYQNKLEKYEAGISCGRNKVYADFFRELLNKIGFHGEIVEYPSKKPYYKVIGYGKQNILRLKEFIGDIPGKKYPEIINKSNRENNHKVIIEELDNEHMNFRKVSSINYIENGEVWDVEYPNKGWFLAGGIKTHNSGKSHHISLGTLFLAIMRPITTTIKGITETRGASIIVASRDDDTVRLIFDNVVSLLDKSPKFRALMEAGYIRKIMSPYPTLFFDFWAKPAKIIFRGPGEGGQATRGKTFDYKIYDEADYIPNAFYETEKATSINAVDDSLTILSSTPTGKRQYFYDACFIAGTKVRISKTENKNIEDIKIGDKVLNRFGELQEVTNTMNRIPRKNGKLVSFMTTLDDEIITCTDNHRFMAIRKLDRYCHQCENFVWLNNTLCPILYRHIKFNKIKPEYIEMKNLSPGDYLAIPKSLAPKKIPKYSKLVDDFLYVPITEWKTYTSPENTIVYNLTVGEDHSYNVNSFGVANCTKKEWNYQEIHVPSHMNPNYTLEKDQEMLEELKGVVYEHEILAEWGSTDCGVFDWAHFKNVFELESKKFNIENPDSPILVPRYKILPPTGSKHFDKPNEYVNLEYSWDDVLAIGVPNFGHLLYSLIPAKENNYIYWFGSDHGYTHDPSEFLVAKEYNGTLKLILRLTLRQWHYSEQCDLISALNGFYNLQAIGIDSTGIGKSVQQGLIPAEGIYNKYREFNFDKKVLPVEFAANVMTEDKFTGKPIYTPVKQYMTDLIISLAQKNALQIPNEAIDKEITKQFRNHTYKISVNGRIEYSKSGNGYAEHIIDALRTLVYAREKIKGVKTPKDWLNSYGSFRSPK